MREILVHAVPAWILICAAALAAMALFFIFAAGQRRRKAAGHPPYAPQSLIEAASCLDTPAVETAARKAEIKGQHDKLPSLYYVLAHRMVETGQTAKAQELLQKSIRGAAAAGQTEVHARARVALGDLAQAGSDLTTACEHWQIARALFVELKQHSDHEAVETRMLRNGCPTDWVLTDF